MRFCIVLDSNRNVYHDAASESGVGRYCFGFISASRIPSVLLLTEDEKTPDRCLIRGLPCLQIFTGLSAD